MRLSDAEAALVAGGEFNRLPARAAAPDRPDGVDDEAGGKGVATGQPRLADGATTQGPAFLQQAGTGRAVDGAIDAAAAQQRGIGGIDDSSEERSVGKEGSSTYR